MATQEEIESLKKAENIYKNACRTYVKAYYSSNISYKAFMDAYEAYSKAWHTYNNARKVYEDALKQED